MKQDKKTTNKSGCTAVLAAAMIAAGGFSAYAGNQGTHGGEWKDTESLRWEWQNGEMSFYGNGSIFSEQHPEISDPEYYLKEAVRYPGEANPGWNTKGEPKANYSWASVEELQKFVNSFDWIHLDEKTRLLYVHNRIAKEREVLTRIITVRRKRQRISRFWKEALASAGISRKNFSSYARS